VLHPRLSDPRRSRLDHDSNCPVDGFHPSFSWHAHLLSETSLLVVAAFFFTVAVAPASILNDTVAVGQSLSDEIFREPVNLICFDLPEKPGSGIMMDTLSRQPDSESIAAPKASVEVQASYVGYVSESTLAALASLPENRGVWLFAFSPWIWSVIVRHSRPPRRRRIRRRR
jgi:hypothetical protein